MSIEWNEQVACSFDPNDKQVTPIGFGTYGAIPLETTTLQYTVRFQNTGTAVAHTVEVTDTLSALLDASSIHLIGFSHTPTNIHYDPGEVLVVRFQGINLPDSASDMPGSTGFFTFTIDLVPTAGHLDEIHNAANIYFDLNPCHHQHGAEHLGGLCMWEPEVLLAAVDQLFVPDGISFQWFLDGVAIPNGTDPVLDVPDPGIYSALVTSVHGCVAMTEPYEHVVTGSEEQDGLRVIVAPNPFNSDASLFTNRPLGQDHRIDLFDAQGRTVDQLRGNGTLRNDLDCRNLAAGRYVLRITEPTGERFSIAVGIVR
ncbi:MAG: T9SS type A sorting domain-containing protein [Flavobacteriales bacterium]|nr:T9SS type A sorting domain-containing protein [Flavobacteriales bacterium]